MTRALSRTRGASCRRPCWAQYFPTADLRSAPTAPGRGSWSPRLLRRAPPYRQAGFSEGHTSSSSGPSHQLVLGLDPQAQPPLHVPHHQAATAGGPPDNSLGSRPCCHEWWLGCTWTAQRLPSPAELLSSLKVPQHLQLHLQADGLAVTFGASSMDCSPRPFQAGNWRQGTSVLTILSRHHEGTFLLPP